MKAVEVEFLMKDGISAGVEKIGANSKKLGRTAKEVSGEVDAKLKETKKQYEETEKKLKSLDAKLRKAPKGSYNEALQAQVKALNAELETLKKQLHGTENSHEQTAQKVGKLTRELNNMLNRLTIMRVEGKKNTQEYRELARAAAELQDNLGDVRQEVTALAHDDGFTASLGNGLQGLAGGATALTGAMSLLVGENENLIAIQTKLQSVMAITMGLQQFFNAINKDSVFRVNFLSKAKDMLTGANARLATALGWTNTQATILMATLTLGASLVITGLVVAINKLSSAQSEANESIKKTVELENDAHAQAIKTRIEIEKSKRQIESFNGTKKEEKRLVEQLNSKHGDAFGKYKTLAQWYDTLKTKSEAYIQVLFKQAKAQSLINKMVQTDEKMREVKATDASDVDGSLGFFQKWGIHIAQGVSAQYGSKFIDSNKVIQQANEDNKKKVLEDLAKQQEDTHNEILQLFKDIDDINKQNNLFSYSNNVTSNSNNDESKKLQEHKENVKKEIKSMYSSIHQQEIDMMKEGAVKRKEQINKDYDDAISVLFEQSEKWKKAQQGSLTDEQVLVLDASFEIATEKRDEALRVEREKQKESLNKLLEDYKGYDAKRRTIDEAYNKDIEVLKKALNKEPDNADVKQAIEERNKAYKKSMQELQSEILSTSTFYDELFADITKKGSDTLVKLLETTKEVLSSAVQTANGVTLQIPSVDEHGNKIKKSVTISVQEFQKLKERSNEISKEIEKNNPLKSLLNSFRRLREEMKKKDGDVKGALAQMFGDLDKVLNQVNALGGALKDTFGGEVAEDIDTILNTMNSLYDVGKGVFSIMQGDMLGGITSVISGATKLIRELFPSMEEQRAKHLSMEVELNRAVRERNLEYARSRNLIRDMIADQEVLSNLTRRGFIGTEKLTDFESKQRELEALKKNLKEELKVLEMLRKELKLEESYSGSSRRTVNSRDDLERRAKADKLSKSEKRLYDSLVNTEGKIKDITKRTEELGGSVYEMIIGASFEGFLSQAGNLFGGLKDGVVDFAKFSEDTISQALLNSFVKKDLAKNLQPLFSELSKVVLSGGNKQELDAIKAKLTKTLSASADKYKEMLKAVGLDKVNGQQAGRAGAISTITQEQASKLEGLFTAGQIHWSNIDKTVDDISNRLGGAIDMLAEINKNTKGADDKLREIKQLIEKIDRDGINIR